MSPRLYCLFNQAIVTAFSRHHGNCMITTLYFTKSWFPWQRLILREKHIKNTNKEIRKNHSEWNFVGEKWKHFEYYRYASLHSGKRLFMDPTWFVLLLAPLESAYLFGVNIKFGESF